MLRHTYLTCLATGAMLLGATLGASAQTRDQLHRLIEARRLRELGRYSEARTILNGVLRDLEKAPKTRFTAIVLDDLGVTDADDGSYAEAENALNHGIAALDEAGGDRADEAALRSHLGELYIAELRPADAVHLLRKVSSTLQSAAIPDPVALSTVFDDLATALAMQRKLDEAEILSRQSMALMESKFGPYSESLASSLLTYSAILIVEHHYGDAIAPAEQAWKILQSGELTVEKQHKASALAVLSIVYYHNRRWGDAVSYARQSVELVEAALRPADPILGLYLANYAKLLKRDGQKKEAKALQKRADEILSKAPSLGASNGYTVSLATLRD